ncbi:hypothetical protein ACJ73_02141 [Blastomyces percursus]|uniref:Uncharacterized protein n=1 Tax=Blastomyces percursus TaxID=1658174 RepID=A0A1J9QED1_9EURO|nr:hypothetical protein ACJ73_02141 [Blastomyces percursus]
MLVSELILRLGTSELSGFVEKMRKLPQGQMLRKRTAGVLERAVQGETVLDLLRNSTQAQGQFQNLDQTVPAAKMGRPVPLFQRAACVVRFAVTSRPPFEVKCR